MTVRGTCVLFAFSALALAGCGGTKSGGTAQGRVAGGPKVAGTYVMSATQAQINARPEHPVGVNDNWGSFRLVLGTRSFRISDRRPAGAPLVQNSSSGSSAGTYALSGNRITFTTRAAAGDTPLGSPGDDPIVCRWSLYRNVLSFRPLSDAVRRSVARKGLDAPGPPLLYVKAWRKVS
jgi:hypothetical protein